MSNSKPRAVSFDEASAFVLGGTSGIGLAVARSLQDKGVRQIMLAARSSERGKAAIEALRGPAEIQFFSCDAMDATSVSNGVAAAEAAFGAVDIAVSATTAESMLALVGNMGMRDIELGLTGIALPPMHLAKAVLAGMKSRGGGVIISIASDAAKVPTPGEAVIGAAMAAITMFSRTLAMEAKRDGIRVNVVTPSLVTGTGSEQRILASPFAARVFAKAAEKAALGLPDAAEIAELVTYLASPATARLTGQVVSLNGGISAA
ncbi:MULTISPECIES: SDR family NAD(P)-dependent oxidoreductase [unclassified Pannonibacter]|uniref:SDR family NAD(P)-dependent oxidoreductase n=1 Tax=unclassified Pannonibacter TaxID=2627228 RepID=UPI0016485C89|nr:MULTISPECIES: SDR family oxidoreductase [unclassified Pannonibacter]